MVVNFVLDVTERKSTQLVYKDPTMPTRVIRVTKSSFANKTAPAEWPIDREDWAEPRKPRAQMTAEERKALRDAAPKLSPAEKLAKLQERARKLEEKIARAAAPVAAAPVE